MIIKCLNCYASIQSFRPSGLLIWFLFNLKIFFLNYQKSNPVKGYRENEYEALDPFYPPKGYPKLLLDLFESQRKKKIFRTDSCS